MAAAVWAMEHFDTYLRGRTFTVYSDHKPIEAHSKRHEKTLSKLQEAYTRWNFNIVYNKRIRNASRLPKQKHRRSHQNIR